MIHSHGEPEGVLLPEDERLALLSALQELSVAAVQLFSTTARVDDFMLRLTERLRCSALVCVELLDAKDGRVQELGAGGLSHTSLQMRLPALPPSSGDEVNWDKLELPYPELELSAALKWIVPLPNSSSDPPCALLIYFDSRPPFADQLRGMVERLAAVIRVALSHRRLHARALEQMAVLEAQSEASIEGILIVSRDFRVMSHNRRFRTMWGFDELPVGATVTPYLNSVAELAVAPEVFLERMSSLMDDPREESTDEIALRDGRTLERYSAPILGANDRFIGRGWYFRDITERKHAEQERSRLLEHEREARLAAEEAVRQRDEFLSAAAHELKTPLTPLTLRLATVEQMAHEGRVQLSTVQKARASLRRLNTLISDLLDLSRLQAGRLKLEIRAMHLNDLVHQAAEDFQLVSPHHRLTVEDRAELVVRADAQRLEQVLTNLLENAIKYSPKGGAVRVAVAQRGQQAVISVSDQGIGIPAEDQERIFERFYRARNAPITKFAGMGLGLFITRTIVERHGGRIWVESKPGEGATFFVALPLLAHDAVRDEHPDAHPR